MILAGIFFASCDYISDLTSTESDGVYHFSVWGIAKWIFFVLYWAVVIFLSLYLSQEKWNQK